MRIFRSLTYISALLLLTVSLRASTFPVDRSQVDKPATLKVLLVHGVDKVFVEAKGRYSVFNLTNNLLLDSGIFGKKGELCLVDGGIKWGQHHPKIDNIRLVPGDSQSTFLLNGIEYKGCLNIRSFGKNLTIINEIDVESYLSATLSPKFPNKLPHEMAEAIAVIARTNAYYFLNNANESLWHVSADKVGYQGYAFTFQKPFLERALEKTRHIIMTYEGQAFPAFWTENSAGRTTTFSAVFRKEALLPPGVKAPFAAHERENSKWAFALSKDRLADLIDAQNVTGVDLFCDSGSNKVYALRIKDGGNAHDISFTLLQQLLGEQKLQSNDFTITSKRDRVIFQGYGQGLGMGLCLLSAKKMAERGDKAPAILKTFFPGIVIAHQHTLSK